MGCRPAVPVFTTALPSSSGPSSDFPGRAGMVAGHSRCIKRAFALHVAALGEIFKNPQISNKKCILTETLLLHACSTFSWNLREQEFKVFVLVRI